MSGDGVKDSAETVGSTLPDPHPDRADRADRAAGPPRLATFDRPEERFELGLELGRGGMGRVVAATDVSLARSVAIKQVLSDRPDDLMRFEREVRITAELEHPSIVPIHEAARDAEGRPYYVMRRIEGDPLSARLSGTNLRTRLALLPNLLAVVDAAAFAHARDIIHRDIKPSNILLGAYGETHLIDWGLARRLGDLDVSTPGLPASELLTQAGHVYGTVAYMAPEQARGEPVDARVDVYALGATLFHVLAGRAPFSHMADVQRLAAAVAGDDHAPFHELDQAIPPELIAIVAKAMRPDRAERYGHAGELAADLRAFLGGQLVGAHNYTTGQRVRRFARRHRFAVVLTAISLITVVAVLLVAFSSIIEDRTAAEIAKQDADQRTNEARARQDLLLIERASALATTEPTRAGALLLALRTDTPHQDRARDAVAKIAAFGISRGAAVHTKQVNDLAFSPDGTTLASVGSDGRVVTYHVATGRTEPPFELGSSLLTVAWLDDHTLLVSGYLDGARVIDLPSRGVRTIGEGAMGSWWRSADRIRYYHARRHAIYEMPLAGGVARELVTDVQQVVGRDDLAFYTTPAGVFVLDGYESRRIGEPAMAVALAMAPDRTRAALSTSAATIEWDLRTGKETRRWPVGTMAWITYAPQGLVFVGPDGMLHVLFPKGGIGHHGYRVAPLWHTQIAEGVAMLNNLGRVTVLDQAGFHELDQLHVGSRVIASRADRMVALGSRDGSVRWLDLAGMAPRPIPVAQTVGACTATDQFLFGVQLDGIWAIDLATHKTRHFSTSNQAMTLGFQCMPISGDRLIAYSPLGISITDLARNTHVLIPGAGYPSTEHERTLYALGTAVFELMPERAEASKIYTAPSTITGLATAGNWIVVVLGQQLRRYDRTTQEVVELTVGDPITTFGVSADGEVWLGQQNLLATWNGGVFRPITSFNRKITFALGYRSHFLVQLEDRSLWDINDGVPQQRFWGGGRPRWRSRATASRSRTRRTRSRCTT